MYPNGNLPNSNSGERHASYQHYSMSQVNNEKPVIQREHEEQSQAWGKPSSVSPSSHPINLESDKNYSYPNRLTSSSSSLFDRNNAVGQESYGGGSSSSFQQQSFRSGTQSAAIPLPTNYGQQSSSSSYSRIGNVMSQQPGIQHFHDVPFYHGFKFQAMPGFSHFSARLKIELIELF